MTDNSLRKHIALTLNDFTGQKSEDKWQISGKVLPVAVSQMTGQIANVTFQINSAPFTLPTPTIPVATSRYQYVPYQANDAGVTVAADALVAGIAGLSNETADLSRRGNLSPLVFLPVANKAWTELSGDPLKHGIYGENGVNIRDLSGTVIILLQKNGSITMTVPPGQAVIINGDLHVSGDVVAGYGGSDQISTQHHLHDGVTIGGGNTSAPIAGT
jgi:hypothetical protein